MKVVAFGATTSTRSINAKLATYVAGLVPNAQVEVLDLNQFMPPLFSEDIEREQGHPQSAVNFIQKLAEADAIVISFAEHNGMYSAAYKNLFDWCTRNEGKNVYQGKPMILLATSEGGRGGKSVLEVATNATPRFGGDVRASISVSNFSKIFDQENNTITDAALLEEITNATTALTI